MNDDTNHYYEAIHAEELDESLMHLFAFTHEELSKNASIMRRFEKDEIESRRFNEYNREHTKGKLDAYQTLFGLQIQILFTRGLLEPGEDEIEGVFDE